ncbi:phage major capsid protein [Acinetobacter sp. UC24323]|uniref:phage major capsid protein n=1 Tax=Acinetobacter sp. UC24323 TaxID=2839946 RepID=UPI0020A0AD12|nr:phage major capsid protein [Acinetobacter sp. UC24323]MCO9048763.1 phage major capsid protein [Acinetobacter sp. UC24323]
MTLAEQIAAIKKSISEKMDEIVKLSGASIEKGVTPDEETENKIKSIQGEVDVLKANLQRLEDIEKSQAEWGKSTPVNGQTAKQGKDSAGGVIEVVENLPKGIGLAMLVRAKVASQQLAKNHSEYVSASDLLKSWDAPERVLSVAKAVVGTTTSSDYSALVNSRVLATEFIDLLRPRTIIGQMKGFRKVPFNITVPTKTNSSIVNWVGEGQKKPVTNLSFGKTSLTFAKIAGIVPFTDELGRFSDPNVDEMVLRDLQDTILEFMDDQFLNPTKAETTDSPASVLNGVDKITASGVTADAIRTDLRKLRAKLISANISLTGVYYVMSETMASFLSDLVDALGNPIFKGMDAPVGEKTLKGLPVVESEKAGKWIALVKPSEILLADDGGIDLSISTEATLEFNDGTNDVSVNLWQENMVGVRAERYVRWKKRHANAAGYIDYSAQTIE